MKSDKIPTSPRRIRRPPLNWLSREASADRAGQTRSDKVGDYRRGVERAASWARWMLATRHGIVVPDGAVLTGCGAAGHFDEYLFVHESTVRGWWEGRTGPRGGRRTAFWHPAAAVRQPITEPFEIPGWCRPVRFADNWHECHQAGRDPAECEMSGMNLRYRQALNEVRIVGGLRLVEPGDPAPAVDTAVGGLSPADHSEWFGDGGRPSWWAPHDRPSKSAVVGLTYGSPSPLSLYRAAGARYYGPPPDASGDRSIVIPLSLSKIPDTT